MDSVYAAGLQDIPNPGVQTALIFQTVIPTPSYYTFYSDPTIAGRKNKFATDFTTENSFGDGTVNGWSAFLPALKWSWEFEKKVKNAKGIKTIEMCSNYNQKMDIFDSYDAINGG